MTSMGFSRSVIIFLEPLPIGGYIMLLSLSLIIVIGFILSVIFKKLRLPNIIGLLITGIILGPCVFDLISPDILNISLDLRQIGLVIILLRAGLSLNIHDLKKIGRPAILIAFVPATLEIVGVLILGPLLLGFTLLESLILGCLLAAVSPAVVVPKMLDLMSNNQ